MVEHKTKSLAQKEAKASELHPWRLELEFFPSRLPCGHPYRQELHPWRLELEIRDVRVRGVVSMFNETALSFFVWGSS